MTRLEEQAGAHRALAKAIDDVNLYRNLLALMPYCVPRAQTGLLTYRFPTGIPYRPHPFGGRK